MASKVCCIKRLIDFWGAQVVTLVAISYSYIKFKPQNFVKLTLAQFINTYVFLCLFYTPLYEMATSVRSWINKWAQNPVCVFSEI